MPFPDPLTATMAGAAWVTVHDEAGQELDDVVTVNAAEGWYERYMRIDGLLNRKTERVQGQVRLSLKDDAPDWLQSWLKPA